MLQKFKQTTTLLTFASIFGVYGCIGPRMYKGINVYSKKYSTLIKKQILQEKNTETKKRLEKILDLPTEKKNESFKIQSFKSYDKK